MHLGLFPVKRLFSLQTQITYWKGCHKCLYVEHRVYSMPRPASSNCGQVAPESLYFFWPPPKI